MTMMPTADQLIEDVYDLIFRRCPEDHRVDVARICKLAAEYRVKQLQRQRVAKAIGARRSTQQKEGRNDSSGY